MASKIKLINPSTNKLKEFDEGIGLFKFLVHFRGWFILAAVAKRYDLALLGVGLIAGGVYLIDKDPFFSISAFLAYITIGLYVSFNVNGMIVKRHLRNEWQFVEPDSEIAKRAKALYGLDGGNTSARLVMTASQLLWAGVAVGVGRALLRWWELYPDTLDKLDGNESAALSISALRGAEYLIVPLITVPLIQPVMLGRKWARIALLGWVALLGALVAFQFVGGAGTQTSFEGAMALLAHVGLYGAALYLIFTRPGSLWFGGTAAERAAASA